MDASLSTQHFYVPTYFPESPVETKPSTLRLGHGGTLDKSAVGVLVVGVNFGCKKLPLLLHGAKNYVAVGQLGISTDTYNERGRITDERPYGKLKYEFFTRSDFVFTLCDIYKMTFCSD